MGRNQFFEDDLLDMIFSNVQPGRTFNARRSAETQYADNSRESWLKRNTAGALGDDKAKRQ